MQEGNEIDQIRYKRNQIQHTTIILISLSLVSPKIGKSKGVKNVKGGEQK